MKKNGIFRLLALAFTIILVLSSIVFLRKNNVEFLYYNALFFVLFIIFFFTERKFKYKFSVLISLGLVMIMHLCGGLIYIGGTRLYDITFAFLQYDNFLHFAAGGAFAFLTLNLFYKVHDWKKNHKFAFFFFIVLCTLGFGAIIEIAEYLGVEFLNTAGVGDYMNNARDLVFDALGGIAGTLIMLVSRNG